MQQALWLLTECVLGRLFASFRLTWVLFYLFIFVLVLEAAGWCGNKAFPEATVWQLGAHTLRSLEHGYFAASSLNPGQPPWVVSSMEGLTKAMTSDFGGL